ncbi:conserved hypothetical protein [Vibrio chagasii]|nr:conserved hypothetical protein [Vibrio chagasii]
MSLYEKFLKTPRTIPSTNVSYSLLASTVGLPAQNITLDHPLLRELSDADWDGVGSPSERPKREIGSPISVSYFFGQDWTRELRSTTYDNAGTFQHTLHHDTRFVSIDIIGGGGGGASGTSNSGDIDSGRNFGSGGGGASIAIVGSVIQTVAPAASRQVTIVVGSGGRGGIAPPLSTGGSENGISGTPSSLAGSGINISVGGGEGGIGAGYAPQETGRGGHNSNGVGGGPSRPDFGPGHDGSLGGGGAGGYFYQAGGNANPGGSGGTSGQNHYGGGGGAGGGDYLGVAGNGGNAGYNPSGNPSDRYDGRPGGNALGRGNGGGAGGSAHNDFNISSTTIGGNGGAGSGGRVVIREYRVNPTVLEV